MLQNFKIEVVFLHDDSERGSHILNLLPEVTNRSLFVIKVVRIALDL